MRHMDSQAAARITAIAGAVRALYITHLVARLQQDAARGSAWTRLADRLIAQDTGLSAPQVRRARRWWAALGVVTCHTRGIPPTEEYAIQATLTAWQAWLQANCIVTPASQQSDGSVTTSGRCRHNVVTPASPLDHDHDDDDRAHIIKKQIAEAESAARALGLDPAQIKEECNKYEPSYPDRYYLKVLRQRIQAAQAPLPTVSPSPPAQHSQLAQRARTGTRARTRPGPPQVTYTDQAREEARARARERIAARRAAQQ